MIKSVLLFFSATMVLSFDNLGIRQWFSNFHDLWLPSQDFRHLVAPCSSIIIPSFTFKKFSSVILFAMFDNKKVNKQK